ncbi:BQ2448_346 [Microbotryum intermedium]|uniref:BQ2448_346 protein n=1 Tax=Microbotryum intermedium TaxID=269621 RepID=A0A238F5B0_9BASI|nr:BQ2448_346 [Microbotryum intermedium]
MVKRKSAQRHYLIGNALNPDPQASTSRLGSYPLAHPTSSTLTPVPSSDAGAAAVAVAAVAAVAGGATTRSRVAAKRRRGNGNSSRSMSDDIYDGHDGSCSPSSSPSLRSLAANAPKVSNVPSLAHLPADILFRIADLLQPTLSPFRSDADGGQDGRRNFGRNSGDGDGGPSLSSQWIDPGNDVISLRSTCRAIYLAIEPLRGTIFGIRLQPRGEGEKGVRLVTNFPENKRTVDPSGDGKELLIARTRQLWIHSTLPGAADDPGSSVANKVTGLIERMPRLRTFAFVQATEDEVVTQSPYIAQPLASIILNSLSRRDRLHSIYLCGVMLQTGAVSPSFAHVTTLVLNACHDCPLQLITACPKLRVVKAWRDFARPSRSAMTSKWWTEQTWTTVKHAELRGFSGVMGRGFRHSWLRNLATLRALPSPLMISLSSLRLCEAYDYAELFDILLPAIAHLPHLTTFTCMVWKDRNFGPNLVGKIASDLPNLVHLGLLLENEGTNWWPGDMASGHYGRELARFTKLETFTWNFTAYVGLDWTATRETSLPLLLSLLSRVGRSFKRLHWLQQNEFILQSPRTGEWIWSDEIGASLERSQLHDVDPVASKENRVDVAGLVPKHLRGTVSSARKKLFDVGGVVGGGNGGGSDTVGRNAPSLGGGNRWMMGLEWEED